MEPEKTQQIQFQAKSAMDSCQIILNRDQGRSSKLQRSTSIFVHKHLHAQWPVLCLRRHKFLFILERSSSLDTPMTRCISNRKMRHVNYKMHLQYIGLLNSGLLKAVCCLRFLVESGFLKICLLFQIPGRVSQSGQNGVGRALETT